MQAKMKFIIENIFILTDNGDSGSFLADNIQNNNPFIHGIEGSGSSKPEHYSL